MTDDEVAGYLQAHPEFFEQHAEVLAGINLPHPHHDGRAVSLGERQLLQMRERNQVLEAKLRELVSFGEENDAISERLHRATVALIRAEGLRSLLQGLYFNLREDFAVPHIAVRLWSESNERDLPEFSAVSEETRVFAQSLGNPYCSHKAMFDSADWFGETAPLLRSFAYVTLRGDDAAFGLLALASEDPKRFYPEMGTLYLKRLGEVVSAALERYL
jgi:uncharacterized protein